MDPFKNFKFRVDINVVVLDDIVLVSGIEGTILPCRASLEAEGNEALLE